MTTRRRLIPRLACLAALATAGCGADANDPCRPSSGGATEVIVGQGQSDYMPLADGDVVQVQTGPQGGHHVWVAIRTRNLHEMGSTTATSGHFPDLGVDVGPFKVIFDLSPDTGGYCKLYGLRFQLDQQVPIQTLLGHPLDLAVTVSDTDGVTGAGRRSVVLSQTLQ
jgi:hypothetical protein